MLTKTYMAHQGKEISFPVETNSGLLNLFKCLVCLECTIPPIMQCIGGHIICKTCHNKLTRCPFCRVYLGRSSRFHFIIFCSGKGGVRNLALEKLAAKLTFPCKHSIYGCAEFLSISSKSNHEETCDYR